MTWRLNCCQSTKSYTALLLKTAGGWSANIFVYNTLAATLTIADTLHLSCFIIDL